MIPAARRLCGMRGFFMRKSFVLTALLALAASSYAQIATITALVGTVSDSSGRAIAGAKVTAVESGTLDKYTAVTNTDGNYRVEFVKVGTYDVTVEYPGFKAMKHTG